MIFGIGIDIFDVNRIKSKMEEDSGFLSSIFTKNEIAYCEKMNHKEQHYAARFSAKEAFLKALGTGWRFGISFLDIEVLNDVLGKPYLIISGKSEEFIKKNMIINIALSISHTKEASAAFVILEQ